jgi:hypothetical protein
MELLRTIIQIILGMTINIIGLALTGSSIVLVGFILAEIVAYILKEKGVIKREKALKQENAMN